MGGDHAITGTFPTLDHIIAFKEGTAEFDHGYYRFVSHPRLRQLEAELKSRFTCRHCRLTESLETALLELILCLHAQGTRSRIVILKEEGAATPFKDERFLPACDREGVSVLTLAPTEKPASNLGRSDFLLIAPGKKNDNSPSPQSAAIASTVSAALAQGAHVIAVVTAANGEVPGPRPEVSEAQFFVLGLRAAQGPAKAGAVLGNEDAIMDQLVQQMKRRGPMLSSRAADCLLGSGSALSTAPEDADAAAARVADALCRLEGGTRAFLYSSGMSAITRVLDLLRQPGKSQIVAVGHLYSDTFQSLLLGENLFLEVDELNSLENCVGNQTAAIFTETITNPLSDVPDLQALSRTARAHGIPLVVDNTIASPLNCNPFEFGADYVIHSTTKYLNGKNDHGGGVVIVRDPRAAQMLSDCQALLDDGMSPLEAAALEKSLGSLRERMRRFNENAVSVEGFLAGHPGVKRTFFNANPSHRSYATARRILKGPGSVIGFTLARDTWEGLRAFYDSPLAGIHKAPSLGSDVTLLCPYTLLTHYENTDEELAKIGLPRFLLRIAVGCEMDIAPVIASLDEALTRSG